jgi:hypothetical protein
MSMTDSERITALEAEVADLKAQMAALAARDARREREHRNLLAKWEELAQSGERQRTETAETMRLFSAYWDQRLARHPARPASASDDDERLLALFDAFAACMGEAMGDALNERETRIMLRVLDLFETWLGPRDRAA